ncbi:hypothetical protein NUACC21_24650 [Scytonema sp. NUACC21]
MAIDDLSLSRTYAQQSKMLRRGLMAQLYATKAINPVGDAEGQNGLLLSDLLSSFKRYAGNQQTAYDNGSVQSSPTNTSNQWERIVDRAIHQVLGRTPGKGATNFINALNTAFPDNGYGTVATMPTYTTNGYKGMGLLAEVSTEQAILYRQVSINMADALKVLADIEYFSPQADKESVESLRELIRSQINVLVEEFRRADEPRVSRVESYLRSLDEYVSEFGKQAYLNNPRLAVTIEDEEQVTNFKLLKSYLKTLSQAWARYYNSEKSGRWDSLSIRVDRARVLLPIVAQANLDFSNALESVGLSENERRSRASLFTALDLPAILELDRRSQSSRPDPSFLGTWLPNITVSDLIDWLDRYSNTEAPSALESTYGIDFVTDQADRLFWTIAPIVAHLKTIVASNSSSQSTLKQILSNERVTWALDNLLSQLNALAELAA